LLAEVNRLYYLYRSTIEGTLTMTERERTDGRSEAFAGLLNPRRGQDRTYILMHTTFIVSAAVVLVMAGLIMTGCTGNSDKNKALPTKIHMEDYFPFAMDRHWEYDWENNSGDTWSGSLTVTNQREQQGLKIYIVVDSSDTYGNIDFHRSAYLWDADGLKHLYRAAPDNDSISFTPPRIVLPAVMSGNQAYRKTYRYNVYNTVGDKRYEVTVRQSQKLVAHGRVEAGESGWDDCVAVETSSTLTRSDGTVENKRKLVWYSRGTGPVKITTGITLTASDLSGEAVGILAVQN